MSHGKWGESDPNHSSPMDETYFQHVRRKSGTPVPMPHLDGDGPPISNSERYLSRKAVELQDPYSTLSGGTISQLSKTRQEQIHALASREPEGGPRPNLGGARFVRKKQLIREAAIRKEGTFSQTPPVNISGRSDTTHIAPELYSPLFLTQNLQLPRDRITANAWNRAFYETNPVVRNAINLHATYPISKLNIKCEDKKKEQFYMDMAENIDLFSLVQHAACEYWKLGEFFAYASLDESTGMWDKVYLHNPDYISVKASAIPGVQTISLRPDPELERIITSNDPAYAKIREQLDDRVIHHVLQGEYIPLDSFNISHVKHLSAPYDVRGTSVIVSVWKDLMLYDKLRESKFIQADSMINPMTLIKVGSSNPDGHYPRPEELQAWREIIEEAQFDRDFKIVTHPDVSIEPVGFSGTVLDTSADFQLIIDNILMGLMVPKAIITQDGSTYASASVALDVMRQRYNNFRTMMANWLIKKIFAPIAEVQDFYRYEGGKKRLVVPEIDWNHMTLYDIDSYIGHLMAMYDKQPRAVSKKTLYRSLGLSVKDENANIKEEMVDEAVLAKEQAELANRSLSDLRALDPEKPIVEELSATVPGAGGDLGLPGASPDLGPPPLGPPGGGGLPGGMDLGVPPPGPPFGDEGI